MLSICGLDCCGSCGLMGNACKGCTETEGHPCGGSCTAAECIKNNGIAGYEAMKSAVIAEINALGIADLHVDGLNLLNGAYVNLEYTLANGQKLKLLEDSRVYFANQVERPDSERCYGIAADDKILLICEYGCNGSDPEIILYKKRG